MKLPQAVIVAFKTAERDFGVTREEILSASKIPAFVAPRAYIARRLKAQGYSLTRIGKYLGGRCHATVYKYLQDPVRPAPFDFAAPDESGVWAI